MIPLFARRFLNNSPYLCIEGILAYNIEVMENCIFCKIVNGEAPCHKIWEDENHLAFLSIFPNTEGFSVVITKQHYPSYAFNLPDDILEKLVIASKKVAKLLDKKLEDVGRTGMIFEGFGVDHVHAKLFPMHGTKNKEWRPLKSNINKYFEKYEGYISSHDYEREDDEKLKKLAEKITSTL
jgi:diadenosine tetraphosphate (Ap4A) HIT family hydrolase